MPTELTHEELLQKIQTIEPFTKGFDAIAYHVIITDENARILYANPAVYRNTGFSSQEILGKNPGALWGSNMTKEFYQKMWQTIKVDKKPFVGEVKNKRKDGSEYWQELRICPVVDSQNEIKFFIGIEPNITEKNKKDNFSRNFISIFGYQYPDPVSSLQEISAKLKNLS